MRIWDKREYWSVHWLCAKVWSFLPEWFSRWDMFPHVCLLCLFKSTKECSIMCNDAYQLFYSTEISWGKNFHKSFFSEHNILLNFLVSWFCTFFSCVVIWTKCNDYQTPDDVWLYNETKQALRLHSMSIFVMIVVAYCNEDILLELSDASDW